MGKHKNKGFGIFLLVLGCSFLVGGIFAYNKGNPASLVNLNNNLIVLTTPTAPQYPTRSAGNANFTVSWGEPADDGGTAIYGYAIFINSTLNETVAGNITSAVFTGLTNGDEYLVKIAAVNAMGIGDNTTELSMMPGTTPSAPRNLAVTAGSGFLCCNWTAPSSNGGFAISAYNIYRSVSSGAEQFITTTTHLSYNDTSYSQNSTRYFKIQAINAWGNSTNSSEKYNTTWAVPTAPRSPVATPVNHAVVLNWTAPARNGGRPIVHYKIYKGMASGAETLLTTLGVALGYNSTGLTNGQIYYYKIAAVNAMGIGANSTEVHGTPS